MALKYFVVKELDKFNQTPITAINKFFTPTIEFIKTIFQDTKYEIELTYQIFNELNSRATQFEINLKKQNANGIPFEIVIPERLDVGGIFNAESYGLKNQLLLTKGETTIVVDGNSLINFKPFFIEKGQKLTGSFTNLYTNNLTRINNYSRMILRVNEHHLIHPTSILEYKKNYIKYDIDVYNQHRNSFGLPVWSTEDMYTLITLNNKSFHFYAIDSISSYVIDSTDKLPLHEFKIYCHIIRIAFAFITGNFYRDEVLYLTSDTSEFKNIINFEYNLERRTITTNYQIIDPTFFFSVYERENNEIKKHWEKYHTMFPNDVFSNFCEIMYSSETFLRAVELIVNAGNELDPIPEGALYSVALETFTEYFIRENEESLTPIQDKKISKEIIKALKGTLDKFVQQISAEAKEILNAKIQSINSPTNRNKLAKPFEILGLNLNPADKLLIGDRNKYLHGNIPDQAKLLGGVYDVTLEMRMLVSKIILKFIGYNGHIINLNAYLKLTDPKMREDLKSFDSDKIIELIKAVNAGSLKPEEIENAKLQINKYQEQLKIVIKLIQVVSII